MLTKKDINPYNEEGVPHGLWKSYFNNGELSYKGMYINGLRHGHWEEYYTDNTLWYKGSFVYGEQSGLWIINNEEYFYAQ